MKHFILLAMIIFQVYFIFREPEHESDISTIGELLEKLQSRRPRMKLFLSQIFLQHDENLKREMPERNIASDGQRDEEYNTSKAEGSCVSAKVEINISQSNAETRLRQQS
jgi:hypothetical protein